MRPLFSISAVLALVALSACTTTSLDTSVDRYGAAPLENFDPSQVRMLPDNPFQAVRPAEIAATSRS